MEGWDGSFDSQEHYEESQNKLKVNLDLNNVDWLSIYAILNEATSIAYASNSSVGDCLHFYGRYQVIGVLRNKVAALFSGEPGKTTKQIIMPMTGEVKNLPVDNTLTNTDWLDIFAVLDEAHSITLSQFNNQHSTTHFWGRYDELTAIRRKIIALFEGTN